MTTDTRTSDMSVDAHWDITYQHVADEITATFLQSLGDEGRLIGRRCPACQRVLLPPTTRCDRDYELTSEWVELPLVGAIQMATVIAQSVPGLPESPYALAYVLVDGADTTLPIRITDINFDAAEADWERLAPGTRVVLELADQTRGRLSDLSCRSA